MGDAVQFTDEVKAQALVCQFLPYARSIARKMYGTRSHYNVPREEFDAAAYLGLCEAASRFDESRGVGFHSFCSRRVRGAIIDMLRKEGFIPRTTVEDGNSGKDGLGADKSAVGVDAVAVTEPSCPPPGADADGAKVTSGTEYSYYSSLCDRLGFNLHHLPGDKGYDLSYAEALHPVLIAEKQELSGRILAALGSLSHFERETIRRRYAEEQDFQSIAFECGMASRSWAFRTHQRAIDKLRAELAD